MNILLWVIQILLVLMFLMSGGMKIVLPIETLRAMGSPNQIILPAWFMKFIGVCEVLGALGLLLPGLLRRQQFLTPLAAACLVVVMIGAVVITVMADGILVGLWPLVTGILCAFVAYERWKPRPLH